MPITENKFTAEELKAAIEANKDLVPILKCINNWWQAAEPWLRFTCDAPLKT